MTEKKPLTPQERMKKFQEGYRKLVEETRCNHIAVPDLTAEGRVIANLVLNIQRDDGDS